MTVYNNEHSEYKKQNVFVCDDVYVDCAVLRCDDLTSVDLGLLELRGAAQNRSFRRMLISHSAMHC